MRSLSLALLLIALALPGSARAFCGFYVGKAGAELYNHASQVVLVRDGQRTVVTMSNDFQGTMKDFALVVPVPSVLHKEQVHVGDRSLVQRIDSYSSPRLVEYFDSNPCERRYEMEEDRAMPVGAMSAPIPPPTPAPRPKVTVEAQYTVGEYDIVILSAEESDALEQWLTQNGYQIPPRAAQALEPYVKSNMKFFVAKVNLKEQQATGFNYLRPIQIAYESEKFMLPIRLGMANSQGEQDLLIYTLTKKGRVESTNYKTEKIPSGETIPLFVKNDFSPFYASVFDTAHRKSNYRALHTEYVWDSGWCDPCADQPLSPEELKGLGVFWLGQGGPQPILTRLHVRYDREHFPEDLVFQETGDRENFQARYILQHPATGDLSCEAGKSYLQQLETRHAQEAKTLAEITGWQHEDVVQKMGSDAPGKGGTSSGDSWYKNLWK
jgi:hypothetical protein